MTWPEAIFGCVCVISVAWFMIRVIGIIVSD